MSSVGEGGGAKVGMWVGWKSWGGREKGGVGRGGGGGGGFSIFM